MKKKYHIVLPLLLAFIGTPLLNAQTEIVLDPTALVPHDDGYYIGGVWLDTDDNGTDEFYNQCLDYWEDEDYVKDGVYDPQWNHGETGEQQGFKYFKTMIMPTCEAKGTAIEPPMRAGYIQIAPIYYPGTDSASLSYVQTPLIRNLQSLSLELSSNISINDNRKIPYFIELSKDNGTTWEAYPFIAGFVEAQGGYRVTYDGTVALEFNDMKTESQSGNIVLRIITNDRAAAKPNTGQFVNIHYISLMAELVTAIDKVTVDKDLGFKIIRQSIISNSGELTLYNLQGKIIASGEYITAPNQGIFLVKNQKNKFYKVFVE